MAKTTPTRQLIPSWDLVPKNLKLLRQYIEQLIIIVLLPALTIDLGNILLLRNKNAAGWIVTAAGLLWLLVNVAAAYYLQLSAARQKTLSTGACYAQSWRYFWRIIGFTILFCLLLVVGLILLVAPGLIVLRRYTFTPFYIIEQDLPVIKAMRLSSEQTKPVAGYVWGTFGIVLALALAAGIISSWFTAIPGATVILSTLLSLSYLFLPVLRYAEISQTKAKTKTKSTKAVKS